MDDNYWKERYKGTWSQSSEREKWLKEYIENVTGLECAISGFGAGSDEYIAGSAKEHGHEIADPDINVVGTRIYIEVTGPLVRVRENSDLWFRPDKVEAANRHYADETKDTFMVNNFARQNLWFVIHVDEKFYNNCEQKKYRIVTPTIRGVTETYMEIPQNDECVKGLDSLIDYLKNLK